MKFLKHINFNFRANFFKKSFIAFFMFENLMIDLSKADDVCECISTFTYKTPNDQIRYVAKCYLRGEDMGILENTILPNQEAADQRTKYFMENYKIKKDACIVLPNGKMITIPSK